ncbi:MULTISPECIES: ATP-binding protein [Paenibacillus]|uniref:histidine kinase n=1 Tax=Paenibacillus borealis TaxID=160799 RepID=A0ABX3HI16_PAEBO|nr:ATP-binding protein [Paenibacillus borealis]OMD48704.1 hypothetical protein BSK56_10470 [Paenibacillus borealis]
MKKTKIWIISTIFMVVLTGLRLEWLQYNLAADYPLAEQGVLDLRGWDSLTEHSLPLNGEWEFYPGVLPFRNGSSLSELQPPSQWIQVPATWNLKDDLYGKGKYGSGTYRLRILLDPDKGESYGVHITRIKSSSEVYINRQLLGHSGQPGMTKDNYTPLEKPYTMYFTIKDQSEIELIIQVSNFDGIRSGGIVHSVEFGLENALRKNIKIKENVLWIACVAYALHALYGFLLYVLGARNKQLISFSMMMVCIIFATLLTDARLLYKWLPFTYIWGQKIVYIVMLSGAFFLQQLIKDKLPSWVPHRAVRVYNLLCCIAILAVCLLPLHLVKGHETLYFALMFIPCLLTPYVMYRSTVKQVSDNIFLFLAALAAVSSMIWLVIYEKARIEVPSYPFDLIIAMICIAAFWFKRFIGVSRDSQELAGILQKADKQKDEFLFTVAHELRNPLHGMINLSESVFDREQNKLGINSANDLHLLVKVGRRMSYMLNDLLDIARLKENQIHLNFEAISVHGVASSVLDMLRFMIEGKPIQLVNCIPADFPPVFADEYRLNQILFNLLHNAIKYSEAGEVSVYAEIKGEWASISVADTGMGMDSETMSRVFEAYVQAPLDSASFRGGVGLGLNICKQLVEMHGGTIEVRSEINIGSIFTFTLKLDADGADGKLPELVPEAPDNTAVNNDVRASLDTSSPYTELNLTSPTDRIQLMVVDDDPVNLNVLKSIFANEHYDLFSAINGVEALALLETGVWDLIISDVTMPIMSGYELTARIRERFSIAELPVLLLTASNREKDIEAGFRSGANDYVTKPVNATELKSRVRSLTNLKKSVNEGLRMEAALLQAQIKPHFLINTFNAVSALSKIDRGKMDDLIDELTNYFRLGIDFQNSDRLVTLDRELSLIRSYLYIQQKRFQDRLQVVWEIDDNIQVQIPPLTIQPLVDNAVTHGILKRPEGGEVRIRVADIGQAVEISVSDNGMGIDEETLKHILDIKTNSRTGIGLLNTDRRLKRFCGSTLKVQSVVESGTVVSFSVAKKL